jgi:RimJ/RimL family protein N-acetyltransferase
MALQTSRLTLRLFTPEDYQTLRELDSDPAVLLYRSRKTISPEETRQFLDRAQNATQESPRTFFAYAITSKESGELLGQCGLTVIPPTEPGEKRAFLWYSLLPKHWGNGYMTESVQALLHLGFQHLGLTTIEAECNPENTASARVMERAGLLYKGEQERKDKLGNRVKRLHYELTGNEWAEKETANPDIAGPY